MLDYPWNGVGLERCRVCRRTCWVRTCGKLLEHYHAVNANTGDSVTDNDISMCLRVSPQGNGVLTENLSRT
jgi:hypothetical protein